VIPRTDMTEKEIATCITFHFLVIHKKNVVGSKKKVLKFLNDASIHRIGHFEINRFIESIFLYKFAHY
jgi:hypothetical protein